MPTILNFQKIKKNWETCLGPKIRQGENFKPCFQLLKLNGLGQFENYQEVYHSKKKEGEAISAIQNKVIHDAENFELVPIDEAKSVKESIMNQEFEICNRVIEIATISMRRVCVTIKKYNVCHNQEVQSISNVVSESDTTFRFDSPLQKKLTT